MECSCSLDLPRITASCSATLATGTILNTSLRELQNEHTTRRIPLHEMFARTPAETRTNATFRDASVSKAQAIAMGHRAATLARAARSTTMVGALALLSRVVSTSSSLPLHRTLIVTRSSTVRRFNGCTSITCCRFTFLLRVTGLDPMDPPATTP